MDDEWEFEVAFKDGTMAWRGLGGPRTEAEAWTAARRMCEPHGHTVVMVRRPQRKEQRNMKKRKSWRCALGIHKWRIFGYNSVLCPLPIMRCARCGIGQQFAIFGGLTHYSAKEMEKMKGRMGMKMLDQLHVDILVSHDLSETDKRQIQNNIKDYELEIAETVKLIIVRDIPRDTLPFLGVQISQ